MNRPSITGNVALRYVQAESKALTAAETRMAIALFTQLKNRQIKGFVPYLRKGEIRVVPVPADSAELSAGTS